MCECQCWHSKEEVAPRTNEYQLKLHIVTEVLSNTFATTLVWERKEKQVRKVKCSLLELHYIYSEINYSSSSNNCSSDFHHDALWFFDTFRCLMWWPVHFILGFFFPPWMHLILHLKTQPPPFSFSAFLLHHLLFFCFATFFFSFALSASSCFLRLLVAFAVCMEPLRDLVYTNNFIAMWPTTKKKRAKHNEWHSSFIVTKGWCSHALNDFSTGNLRFRGNDKESNNSLFCHWEPC